MGGAEVVSVDGSVGEDGNVQHVASLYAHGRADRAPYPRLSGTVRSDIAIVGGGLAGLTAARELHRRGYSVCLLESKCVDWGASGRNGGFVAPGFAESLFAVERRVGLERTRALYTLSEEGVAYVSRGIAEAGRPDIIGGTGWMHVVRHRKTDRLYRQRDRMARDYGVDLQVLDGPDVQSRLRAERYRAALVDPRPIHIDPLAYVELLATECAKLGVQLFERSRVSALRHSEGGFLLETAEGRLQAEQVVVATSAYGGPVAAVENCVLPVATYVVASEPADEALREAIAWSGCIAETRRAGDYYRIVSGNDGRRLL